MGFERPKMPVSERAKQFMPFAAVRGLEEALERKRQETLFEEKIVLAKEGEDEINETLSRITPGCRVAVRYYNGRNYEEESFSVLKEDVKTRTLSSEGMEISFDDIVRLEIID